MNTLVNQAKSRTTEDLSSMNEENNSKNVVANKSKNVSKKNLNVDVEKRPLKASSPFVKVNMDGIPIGRKVNLSAHNCYETLAQTLDDMFCRPTATINARSEFFILFYSVMAD